MGKIYAAKTNHITNPVGFYLKPLVFSWKVKGCRGQEQKHARIVISKNKTFTDICYDTGEAGSDNNLGKLHFLQGGRVSGYDKPEPLCLWMRGRLDVPEDKRH